jgi:hypothetical protein
MILRTHRLMVFLCASGFSWALSQGQTVLFSDNFDTDTSGIWTIKEGSGTGVSDYTAQFAFDYSTNKFVRNGVTNTIPPAPSGGGKGLKLTVNKNDDAADTSAVCVFPAGQVFSNDYALRFDMWINYNGGAFGGSGSTEFAHFGLNTVGDKVDWDNPTFTADGVWFAVDGEAGANRDWRSYIGDGSSPALEQQGSNGGFLDRDGDGIAEQEVFEDPETAPLDVMFPPPTFETPAMPSKQWVQMEIRQRTNDLGQHVVTWLVEGYVIAEHNQADAFAQTMGNIMLGTMDIYTSIASPKQDNFVIYDNVRVVDLSGVPTNFVVGVTGVNTNAAEPATDGLVRVSRSGDASTALTVPFRMSGSATRGADYVTQTNGVTFTNNAIVIPAGSASLDVTIHVLNDNNGEATETVAFTLAGNPGLYEIREGAESVVFISDDGDLPTTTVTTFRPGAYESIPARFGQFRVSFSNPYFNNVTINYTLGGDAVNGTHYSSIGSSVVMTSGTTDAYIDIVPIDNTDTVSNRLVTLTLAIGANYVLSTTNTNATVVIFNDDLPPAVSTLFSDTFETDSSANWNINPGHANDVATFAYDYGSVGIPPAPHTVGATTRGVKLEANNPNLGVALFSGISVSPMNQSFTGEFRLRFDWWPNFPGPFPGGGSGSTQLGTAGITRGTIPQWPGGSTTTLDSTYFAFSGDGGTSADVRVYTTNGGVQAVTCGVYAAGTGTTAANNSDPYYAVFGNQAAPEAQLNLFPSQAGLTYPGAPGQAWHDVVITKRGDTLTWIIDGLRMATINSADFGISLSTNIFVGQSDINNGQAGIPDMLFSLVDNLVVEQLAQPTVSITSIHIVGANAEINFTGGTDDPVVAYKLLEAVDVTGTYVVNSAAAVTTLAPGSFKVTVPTAGAGRFYRIRR